MRLTPIAKRVETVWRMYNLHIALMVVEKTYMKKDIIELY